MSEVGLPVDARGRISAVLSTTFALLARDTPSQTVADNFAEALNHILELHGEVGLFEAACAAALLVSDGEFRIGSPEPGEWKYLGFGRDAAPGRPLDYRLSEFGTAVMHGRREQAWALWCDLQPPGTAWNDETREFMAQLLRNAWVRARGGALQVTLQATKWPPVCDFCCGETALWMWHVEGADVHIADPRPGASGDLTLRMDDMEYWFACRVCRSHIACRRPDWERVWQRHHRNRPQARRPEVLMLYRAYYALRRTVMPVPLPDERPQPSTAFYNS